MPKEAQDTDFENHTEVVSKYKNIKLKLALLLNKKENPTTATDNTIEEQVDAFKGQQMEDGKVNEIITMHDNSSEDQNRSIDDIKELEKFRLGVWLAKTFVLMMATIVLGLIVLFITATYLTKTLPDLSILESIFNHLKDVVVIIANTEK